MWRSVEGVLRLVERRLAEHAATVLGAKVPEISSGLDTLTLEELEDRPPDSSTYASMWGEWATKEETYYRACRDVVANLDRTAFEHAFGDEEMAAAVEKAQSMLDRGRENEGAKAEKITAFRKSR